MKDIILLYCPSEEMLADPLTKAMPKNGKYLMSKLRGAEDAIIGNVCSAGSAVVLKLDEIRASSILEMKEEIERFLESEGLHLAFETWELTGDSGSSSI